MLRIITGSLAVAVLGAVAIVGAQSSSRNAQQTSSVPETTLSGCLKPGPAPNTYILEAAQAKQDTSAAGQRPVGTSGAVKRTYTLTGQVPPGVKLSEHANQKVEIVGVVVGPAPGEKQDPKMNMRLFKQVAARCQ